MKNFYSVGFDNSSTGNGWNGIAGVYGLKAAKALAAEIAEEYGELPEIRKVVSDERPVQEARLFHNPY